MKKKAVKTKVLWNSKARASEFLATNKGRLGVPNFCRDSLKEYCESEEQHPVVLEGRLSRYCRGLYERGMRRILEEGDKGGWGEIFLGFQGDSWAHKYLAFRAIALFRAAREGWPKGHPFSSERDSAIVTGSEYDPKDRTWICTAVGDMAFTLLSAFAFEEWKFANWYGGALCKVVAQFDYPTDLMAPIWALAFGLYRRLWKTNWTESDERLDDYSALFDLWKNKQFDKALTRACDYHCKHNRREWHSFDQYPFKILPIEIAAIYSVRRKLKLVTPEIDHPLLKTPLFPVPTDINKNVSDPLLTKAIKCLTRLEPELKKLA